MRLPGGRIAAKYNNSPSQVYCFLEASFIVGGIFVFYQKAKQQKLFSIRTSNCVLDWIAMKSISIHLSIHQLCFQRLQLNEKQSFNLKLSGTASQRQNIFQTCEFDCNTKKLISTRICFLIIISAQLKTTLHDKSDPIQQMTVVSKAAAEN